MNQKLYIVMPTYNEEANIKEVVASWYPVLSLADENSKFVISDGGSTDKTLQMLFEMQRDYPKLVVIPKPNTDHGTKVLFLYKYAIESGADWIFQTDSDGQTLPAEFNAFWNLRTQYDAIIGNRIKRGDGSDRKFVENVLRAYLLFFFGKLIPDANAPFRLMKADLVKKYINIMPDGFNLPNAILTECFAKYNENITFREITFQPRQGGKNYMNWKRIIKIGQQSISNFAMIKRNMRQHEKQIRGDSV